MYKTKQAISCRKCMWFDQCDSGEMCEHYTPLNGHSDSYYEILIESERDEYRNDFIEYIGEFNEDLYY